MSENLSGLLESLLTAVTQHTQDAGAAETERLKNVVHTLGERLRGVLAAHESLLMAVARRDTLLWWRLGGRSKRLGTRYHEAPDTATAVVAAAFDLHDRASDVAPEAVEHLLIDVLHEAGAFRRAGDHRCHGRRVRSASTDYPHRRFPPPLLVVDVVVGGRDPNGLVRALQGPIPAPAAATALFRDLQIRRLLADESREDGPGD